MPRPNVAAGGSAQQPPAAVPGAGARKKPAGKRGSVAATAADKPKQVKKTVGRQSKKVVAVDASAVDGPAEPDGDEFVPPATNPTADAHNVLDESAHG